MGQSMSAPITSQCIERQNTAIFKSALNHVCGFRPGQEDAHALAYNINSHNLTVFGVFDGHGGDLCSNWLGEHLADYFVELDQILDSDEQYKYFMDCDSDLYEKKLTEIMLHIDADFLALGVEDGSTACIVLAQVWDLINDRAITGSLGPDQAFSFENKDKIGIRLLSVNIGDSRAIIIRHSDNNNNNNIYDAFDQITEDHKPTDPMERQRILLAGGFVQNGRVDGSLALSRAFGDANYKREASLPPEEQRVIVVPSYEQHTCYFGDILLIACDGIFESQTMSEHETVASIVRNWFKKNVLDEFSVNQNPFLEKFAPLLYDPALLCRWLIQESIALGSKDNHTAMVISFAPVTNEIIAELQAQNDKLTPDSPQSVAYTKALQYLTTYIPSLPEEELVPGYCRIDMHEHVGDMFQDYFIQDLSKEEFDNYKDLIAATTRSVSHCVRQTGPGSFNLPLPWLGPCPEPSYAVLSNFNTITCLSKDFQPFQPPDLLPLKDEFVKVVIRGIIPEIDQREVDESVVSYSQFIEPYHFVPPIILIPWRDSL